MDGSGLYCYRCYRLDSQPNTCMVSMITAVIRAAAIMGVVMNSIMVFSTSKASQNAQHEARYHQCEDCDPVSLLENTKKQANHYQSKTQFANGLLDLVPVQSVFVHVRDCMVIDDRYKTALNANITHPGVPVILGVVLETWVKGRSARYGLLREPETAPRAVSWTILAFCRFVNPRFLRHSACQEGRCRETHVNTAAKPCSTLERPLFKS